MIKFILLRFQFRLESIDIIAQLSQSLTISIAISKKLISKTIDSLILLLCIRGSFFLLKIKLILQSIDFSAKSKFPFFLLDLLLLFISDKILNFQVLVSEEPVELIDFSNQCSNLLNMTRNKISCIFLLDVLVLDLNINHFRSIYFLKGLNLFTKTSILLLNQFQFMIVSITKILVFCKLVFELSIFIIISSFQLSNLLFKNENLINVIFLKGLNLNCFFG